MQLKKENTCNKHFRKGSPGKVTETTLGQLVTCGSNQIKKKGSPCAKPGLSDAI